MGDLLKEFTKSAKAHKKEIEDLQNAYLLKKVENEVIQEKFNKIYDEVLAEHEFCAREDFHRGGYEVNKGDRITSNKDAFLLSNEDFDKYLDYATPKMAKAGLTDLDGNYTEKGNTENQLSKIKEQLIRMAVDILPDSFPNKDLLYKAIKYEIRNSWQTREKLFEIIMRFKVA